MNIYSLAFFRSAQSGYESPRAGTSQSIFFDNFIPSVVRAFRVVWGGWELWIHHDDRVKDRSSWPFLVRCAEAGMLKLIPMGQTEPLCKSMLWRMQPLWLQDNLDVTPTPVHTVVCRDVDSLPMHRDRKMVEQAFSMGARCHAILDSESHSGPLMGGMVAFRGAPICQNALFDDKEIDFNVHGSDQRWLNKWIWPSCKEGTIIHQRRRDIQYPEAMKTLPVAPQETELDKVVRHVGAGYPRELAMEVLKRLYPDPELDAISER